VTTEISQISSNPALAAHVAEIRLLRKRALADIIEIGRRLTKCRDIVGHGNWQTFLDREFGWSATTALNFMRFFDLTKTKSTNFADLDLPVSSLYLLAAPGTPEEARAEIIQRAEAGEQISSARVKEMITRAKREKNGTTETNGPAEPADDATASADTRRAFYATTEHAAGDDDHADDDHGDADHGGDDDHASAPAEPAPDPVASASAEPAPDPAATAAAAVNQLSATELPSFFNQLSPALMRLFERKFGARDSDNINAEIATLAGECSALLTHAKQNTGDIHKKLARIKTLVGGKLRTSNVRLDRDAFARGMGIASPPDKKFPTMTMTPDGVDESGNAIFALPRGDRSRVR
jgi:hypothetical protein